MIKKIFLICSIYVFLSADNAEIKIVKMCNNKNWAPIEFLDDSTHTMKGIAIDTLKLIEKKVNIKFEHIHTKSWGESQKFLKDKKCDILPAAIKTKERQKYANFTKTYLSYDLAFVTKNDKPFIYSIDSVKNKVIARKKNSGLVAKLQDKYPNIKIIKTKDSLESLKKVASGKAYYTIATLPVTSYLTSKFMLYDLHIAGYSKMKYNLRIAVRDDDIVLLNILNTALNNITIKEHNDIFNKWAGETIKETIDYSFFWKVLIVGLIIILAILYRYFILRNANKNLRKQVNAKTKALRKVNEQLELDVQKKVKELRQKDTMLIQQSRQAAMGEMIGNIAHQWRQPLNILGIKNITLDTYYKNGMIDDKFMEEHIQSSSMTLQHMSDTIDDFKDFFKPDKHKEDFNVYKAVKKSIDVIKDSFINHNITYVINDGHTIIVNGYKNEFSQVVLVLITNAKDAIKSNNIKDGKITINIIETKDTIVIEVKDNAGGVPDEIKDKIFEPYFTTKHQSSGTGIGLYMSKMIIENNMDGYLSVFNDEDGAVFTIQLSY